MKNFIMVPTYNESENISALLDKIFEYLPDAHVVVVDDDSPDKTWKIAEDYSHHNLQVHVLHRTEKRGRGTAGIAGFAYALQHGADAVLEMDADFSHDPKFLPLFFNAIQDYDVVSGSRFIQGGEDGDRGFGRQMITAFANSYIRFFLKFKLTDCSSGYRCYRKEVLRTIGLERLVSTGPSIVQEILFRAAQMGFRILEIPIVFQDREIGKSKLTYRHLFKGFAMVLKLRFSKHSRSFAKVPSEPEWERNAR